MRQFTLTAIVLAVILSGSCSSEDDPIDGAGAESALVDAGYDAELILTEGSHTALTEDGTEAFSAVVQQAIDVADR